MNNLKKRFLKAAQVTSIVLVVFSPLCNASNYDERVYRIQLMLEMMDKVYYSQTSNSTENSENEGTDYGDDPNGGGQPPNSGGVKGTSDGGGGSPDSCNSEHSC